MKISLGLSLVIAGVAIVLAMVAGAWWWWNENAAKIAEAGLAASDEGRKAGASLGESGCLDKAVERHRVDDNRTILGTVRTTLFLRACLDASKAEAVFCEGVPAKGEVLATGTWAGNRCANLGFTDPYCAQMFNQIAEYCSSSDRASKLRPAAARP